MVSENWPTYVVLAIYIALTLAVTIAANIKNKDPTDSSSRISKHFLASKNFGSVLLTFTTFASVFSGYTVVGVPNEAGVKGFFAVRWMALIIIIAISMLWLYPRLRRLSMVRSYESPGDFIADRFKNKAVSILVALLVCIPQVLYIGINLYSLGAVVDSLTQSELGFYPVVIFSTIMILLFEAFGGMRSVAYTDAVEAIVMVIVFITIPIMIAAFTKGGFVGMVNNSQDLTVSCKNSNSDDTSGCLNYALDPDELDASEYFLRSPASATVTNYVLFTLSGVSFALNPHITQRALSAKSDSHVRFVVIAIFLTTFITMTPGILTGIAHISNKPELNPDYTSFGAFQAMLAIFRDRGGFSAFISYIALLAGIAGIMSTADSALIGVSNTISVDIFKNWIFTGYNDNRIVLIGKACSLCTMCLCLIFSIVLFETGADYGVVYTIQQGLLWQAVPAYIFGLYSSLGTYAVLTGTIVGTLVDIILIGVVFGGSDPFPLIDKSWSTLLGVAINIFISIIAHFCIFKGDRSGDDAEILSLDKIREIMKGITEPIIKYYGLLVWLTGAATLISAFHWIGDADQDLINQHGEETTKAMLYNGQVRKVIAGLPDYILATFLWYLVAVFIGIVATMQWTVNEKYSEEIGDNSNISMAVATNESEENKNLTPKNNDQTQIENVELAIDAEI